MKEICEEILKIIPLFDEKTTKKYKIDVFVRLCKKISETQDLEVIDLVKNNLRLLQELSSDNRVKPLEYKKSFAKLQKVVRKKFGYVPKDQIKGEYMAMGIALGVAFGSPFIIINPALSGIGLPIGLAIGLAIGDSKEKAAVEAGKVY